ncbi:hypothetical protein [Actinoplanes sandaracinus]|uniref:hypothetical protein n=1 Tax=Actinoplanes sandaracinus TaxID=3045177 RepID=UPI0038992C4D
MVGSGPVSRGARSCPLSRWNCPDLAAEAVDRRIVAAISASTIRRILARDTIKPWQHQSWIFIRDPRFAVKAARVLGLYARTFDGVPLGDDEYVISSDEKTSIQARCRHPTRPASPARSGSTMSTSAKGSQRDNKLRCCPRQATVIVQAILVLDHVETNRYAG